MNAPVKIKLNGQETLTISWKDGKEYDYPLKFLRDESPDAGNKGETILWQHYEPPAQGPDKPGKYQITNIEIVGNYAMQITWKDGNSDGIYPWELLREWGERLDEIKKD